MKIQRKTIMASDDQLDELRRRLLATRWPDQLPGTGWTYGTDSGYLRELCDYWGRAFDWRSVEARVNEWPHYEAEISGQRIHFLHARSGRPDAVPILLLHGWPGSVLEFLKVIPLLTDPAPGAGPEGQAFHVVCPSMPGFGWS